MYEVATASLLIRTRKFTELKISTLSVSWWSPDVGRPASKLGRRAAFHGSKFPILRQCFPHTYHSLFGAFRLRSADKLRD